MSAVLWNSDRRAPVPCMMATGCGRPEIGYDGGEGWISLPLLLRGQTTAQSDLWNIALP